MSSMTSMSVYILKVSELTINFRLLLRLILTSKNQIASSFDKIIREKNISSHRDHIIAATVACSYA